MSHNSWQKQISSGFDSLINFASSELDRSKEIRRKSMETDQKCGMSSGPPRITPSSISLQERLPGSPSMDDKSGMPTLTPVEGSKERKVKSGKSPQQSSPQHRAARSRSSSSDSKSSRNKDSSNHLSIKQSIPHSRSRSPSPRAKDKDSDDTKHDKYSKYDKHFKKKFFGKDYNFKKQNAQKSSEGVYGKFKHVKGKDWEKNQETSSQVERSSSKASSSSSSPPVSSSPSTGPAGKSSRPASNSSINGSPNGPHKEHNHRNSPEDAVRQKMAYMNHPMSVASTIGLGLSNSHPSFSLAHSLRHHNPSPPVSRPHSALAHNSLLPELARPDLLAGGPFGRPPHLGEGQGLAGSRLPPHMAPAMLTDLHNGPRFDVRNMPMFSDLTSQPRPGFLPNFRPGLLDMNHTQLDLLHRPPFPTDVLPGPPRLFPINAAKDKTWKS